MHTLVIRHIGGLGPDRFFIQRADGKTSDPVEIHSPATWPVEGQPEGLARELNWYLETFLDYPFSPWTERAERVQAAVRAWGRAAFNALFGTGHARDFYRYGTRAGLERLRLQVRSDDPRVLSWPWEALEDGEAAPLAISGRIERALEQVADPPALPAITRRHHQRLREVYRSAGWPFADMLEVELLAAGLLERRCSSEGPRGAARICCRSRP